MGKTDQQVRFYAYDSWEVVKQQPPFAWAYMNADGEKCCTTSAREAERLLSQGVQTAPLYATGQLHAGIVEGFGIGEASAIERAAKLCDDMAADGYEQGITFAEAIRALSQKEAENGN